MGRYLIIRRTGNDSFAGLLDAVKGVFGGCPRPVFVSCVDAGKKKMVSE